MEVRLQGKISCTGCGLLKAVDKVVAHNNNRKKTKKL